MKSFHRSRLCARAVLAVALSMPLLGTQASPWVDVGDERTRHHLQYLNDTGLIQLSLTTWPLPWSRVADDLDTITLSDLTPAQLWSYRYVKHALEYAQRPVKTEKRFYGSNSILPFTQFASDSREQASATSKTTILGKHLAANIEAHAVRRAIDDDRYHYDGSFLAGTVGNWIVGVGAPDRWWGPGWQSSLILSNNARPAQGLFLKRKHALPSRYLAFSWLGEWSLDVFANQLESDRAVPKAKLLGARFTLSPWRHIELGFSHLALSGGDDQAVSTAATSVGATSVGATSVGATSNSFIVNTASLSRKAFSQTGQADDNNALSSYDARIHFSLRSTTFSVYGQYLANEAQANSQSASGTLLGFESGFAWQGIHHRLALELADTRDNNDSGVGPPFSGLYDHSAYPDGYRTRLRNVGESAGTNALKYSLLGAHYFENGQQLNWRLLRVELNQEADSSNFYSSRALEQQLAEIYYKIPVGKYLRINFGVFILDVDMQLASQELESGGNLHFEFRFN